MSTPKIHKINSFDDPAVITIDSSFKIPTDNELLISKIIVPTDHSFIVKKQLLNFQKQLKELLIHNETKLAQLKKKAANKHLYQYQIHQINLLLKSLSNIISKL